MVGVARTIKYIWLAEPPTEYVYLPLEQNPAGLVTQTLVVESYGDSASLVEPLREVVRGLDPNMAVFDVSAGVGAGRDRTLRPGGLLGKHPNAGVRNSHGDRRVRGQCADDRAQARHGAGRGRNRLGTRRELAGGKSAEGAGLLRQHGLGPLRCGAAAAGDGNAGGVFCAKRGRQCPLDSRYWGDRLGSRPARCSNSRTWSYKRLISMCSKRTSSRL